MNQDYLAELNDIGGGLTQQDTNCKKILIKNIYMIVKEEWTDNDFDMMGWHDSCIYSIAFPMEDQKFILDIDYIFKWDLDATKNQFKFWVSPCVIVFNSVINLKMELDFKDSTGLDVEDVKRLNQKTIDGYSPTWEYRIETDKGLISFRSSGFIQRVLKQPVFGYEQSLGRNSSPRIL